VDEVAKLLNCSAEQLHFLLYGRPEKKRYTIFTIRKRRGGERTIRAPRDELKAIQRRFASLLQTRWTARPAAHGFVPGKSIVTNAQHHVKHRAVFNIDLKDFFSSINFGRVRGLFMAKPFLAPASGATILAQICCHEGMLPQGAPTSPIISNMICWKMDAELQQLAKKYNCIYTRYADDITFSKRKGIFPEQVATTNEQGEAVAGQELRTIIVSSGFQPHPEKVHLYRNTERQTVTGLTVNSRVNVPRRFVRAIRAMINDWEQRGLQAAEQTHHKNYYSHPDNLLSFPPLQYIIEGKLNFLKMVRGIDDPVRRNLQRRLVRLCPDYQSVMEKENNEIDKRDLFISHASEDKADFVRPLVQALIKEGVTVWYDEIDLTIGDGLAKKINEGLVKARYGVVVLSPSFFNIKKTWPNREVDAMFAMEDADLRPRVLPIWYKINQSGVAAVNPILAGKIAWQASEFSPEQLAIKFREFMKSRRKK
jgi:retron-type reverse transcriptase